LRSIIEQRRCQVHEGRDILGVLLGSTDEAGNKLSDAEIITQILNLLFGAHETTAKLLFWTLFELSFQPQWLEKLRQEQIEVLQGNSFCFSHLTQLKQMGYVLKEIERLHPPIYSIPRGVRQDVEYGGYFIPQGWYVVISPLLTHRLSNIYSDPHRFNPNRFAPLREEDNQHSFALIGFGGGSHKCLGEGLAKMESKIILSMLLRRYNWSFKIDRSTVMPVCQANKVESQMWAKVEKIQ
jgi:cytochrome P450